MTIDEILQQLAEIENGVAAGAPKSRLRRKIDDLIFDIRSAVKAGELPTDLSETAPVTADPQTLNVDMERFVAELTRRLEDEATLVRSEFEDAVGIVLDAVLQTALRSE